MDLDKIQKFGITKFSNPKDFHLSWLESYLLLCRCNPIRSFDSSYFPDEYKKWIIRSMISSKDPIRSIINLINKYPHRSYTNFLWYCSGFPHIAVKLSKLYEKYNTWEIAKIFNTSQTVIRRLYGSDGLDITNRSMRCSKIHLITKPIIESILGPTVTEYYFDGYWFDEYSKKYNLDIEIDGEWCHNKEYDDYRDSYVLSKGINVLRIKAYTPELEIRNILKDYINSHIIENHE